MALALSILTALKIEDPPDSLLPDKIEHALTKAFSDPRAAQEALRRARIVSTAVTAASDSVVRPIAYYFADFDPSDTHTWARGVGVRVSMLFSVLMASWPLWVGAALLGMARRESARHNFVYFSDWARTAGYVWFSLGLLCAPVYAAFPLPLPLAFVPAILIARGLYGYFGHSTYRV